MMRRPLELTAQAFASRLGRCRRGGIAVEFALTAPLILAMLIGVVELAMILLVNVLLEGGVREASRYGVTGQQPDGRTREERIVEIVSRHTMGLLDIAAGQVQVMTYPSFGAIGAGDSEGGAEGDGTPEGAPADAGGPGAIVLYRVRADWHLLTPLFSEMVGDGGRLTLQASVAVRNEPFELP